MVHPAPCQAMQCTHLAKALAVANRVCSLQGCDCLYANLVQAMLDSKLENPAMTTGTIRNWFQGAQPDGRCVQNSAQQRSSCTVSHLHSPRSERLESNDLCHGNCWRDGHIA
jgi:hypothetical protein